MDALTILDEIRVATPCQARWDEMPGDDRVRYCRVCARSVYNVSAMTSDETVALIAGREGRLCARLFRRADGTLVTADCPAIDVETPAAPRPNSRLRRVHAFSIVLVALLLTWTVRSAVAPPPSGTAVTWDDWVHWAAVSLGLRPTPPSAPVYAPTITMGSVAY
jgi:hypothetical protein